MLSKTSFLDYRACPKSFWLAAHDPGRLAPRIVSPFDQMLAADGYAVEEQVRHLVARKEDAAEHRFQVVFEANECHARADLVRDLSDGRIDLYEIKSSSSVVGGGKDHRVDACFQMICAERAGTPVRRIFVIHVDAEYIRDVDVSPDALLVFADVTNDIREMEQDVAADIDAALALLGQDEIDRSGCECRYHGSVANRCRGFDHLNPDVSARSAHLLPRVSKSRLQKLDEEGRLAIEDVTAKDVTTAQMPVLEALHQDRPVVDRAALDAFLATLEEPIFFYDFEGYGGAVPMAPGWRPHAQVPVQFSAHILEDGHLSHHEHLSMGPGLQDELVASLQAVVPHKGSAVVWSATYEKGRNRLLAELVPEAREFLEDLNDRTVDLMDAFKRAYVDPRFGGSTSIKKVLPVVCPTLHYDEDAVHDGTGAMQAWLEMVTTTDTARRDELQAQLLKYCELDSFAMVQIYRFLVEVSAGGATEG